MRREQNGIAAEGHLMRMYLLALPNHRGQQGTTLAHWREVPALTLSLPGTAHLHYFRAGAPRRCWRELGSIAWSPEADMMHRRQLGLTYVSRNSR